MSNAGSLAFQVAPMAGQLEWLDRSGKIIEKLGEPQRYGDISLSSDGSLAAFTLLSPDGTSKVWSLDLARGTRMPLTPDTPEALMPVLAPAGNAIVYAQRDAVRRRTVLRRITFNALESRAARSRRTGTAAAGAVCRQPTVDWAGFDGHPRHALAGGARRSQPYAHPVREDDCHPLYGAAVPGRPVGRVCLERVGP